MFDKIESLIIKTIKSSRKFSGFDIVPFPENFKDYQFSSARGCILVKYDGSEYSKPQTVNFVRQDETLEFSVMLGFRYAKTLKDVYPHIKKIHKVLTGLDVFAGKKLYPQKREYIGHIKGDLYYGYVFAVTVPSTEEPPDDTPPKISPFAQTKKSNIDLIA